MYLNNSQKISMWAEDDKPREKLLNKGSNSISNSELLAIFINSGLQNKSALDLAKELLQMVNNDIQKIKDLSIHDLLKIKGIGQAKAISILALIEFSKRMYLNNSNNRQKVNSSKDIFNYLKYKFFGLKQEEFHVIMFNSQREIIDSKCISKGNIDKTLVDNRILFKYCIDCYSCSFAIAHNHPSGSLNPSESDKKLTENIKQAGKILSLELVDHLIITNDAFFSFYDNSLL